MSTPKFGSEIETMARLFKMGANLGAGEEFWKCIANNEGEIFTDFMNEFQRLCSPFIEWSRGLVRAEQGYVFFPFLSLNPIEHRVATKRLSKLGSPFSHEELSNFADSLDHYWGSLVAEGISFPIMAIRNVEGKIGMMNPVGSIYEVSELDYSETKVYLPKARFAVFVAH